MENSSKGGIIVSTMEKFLGVVKKYSFADYMLAALVLMFCFMMYTGYKVVNSDEIMRAVAQRVSTINKYEHEKLLVRQRVTPQINYELEKMLFQLNADRTFIIELHNGKENATYLPFLYYDMTYEEVNKRNSTERIAQNFQNVNISTFKLPYYLERHFMFIGNAAEINEIDNNFGENFTKFGGAYGGFVFLKSGGKEIGFLGVAFDSEKVPDKKDIQEALIEYGQIISPLLDLDKQVDLEIKTTNETEE